MSLKFLFSLCFILLLTGVKAQNGQIFGLVADAGDDAPIEFATIALYNSADSALVGGTVAQEDGSFRINKLNPGNYFLRIAFIGYEADTVWAIALPGNNVPLDLGKISLKMAAELEAVDIVAAKSVFENRIDKKIFNADQSLVGKGGNGLDLMRQIPSITVDQNDNILLRGDGNVTLLVDGRPSAMPVNEFMKQIPASAIERIEIITNPSAKYDPEGMSGIINIVLKKNKLKGFNGSVTANVGYGIFPKASSSIALNYRKDKFNVTGNYSYNYSKVWFGGNLQRNVLNDTVWDRLRSDDYGERISAAHAARLGVDYFLNDRNTLFIAAGYNQSLTNGSRGINYRNVNETGNVLGFSNRDGVIQAPNSNLTANGGWQKTFKKPDHTLDLDLSYGSNALSTDERVAQNYFDQSALNYLNTYQNTAETNAVFNSLSKLDYVLPISDSLTLEAGVHFTMRGAENTFYSESATDESAFSPDLQLNNNFSYKQHVLAGYVTLAKQFHKLGLKAGLRSESTETSSVLVTTNEQFSNQYFKLFPSAHLSYKMDKNAEIQVSYSKRINRPEMDQLNPFTNYSDQLTLERGNPFLRPEIIHVNEITYIKFWQKLNVNATVYYRIITDLIRRTLTYQGVYSTVTYANLGQSTLTGGDLTLTLTPKQGMRIISSTNFWNTSTKDVDLTEGVRKNYVGLSSSLQGFYQFKKGWSTQLWASYSPVMNVIQGSIAPNYGGGFAIQKSVFKQRGSITASFVDVFKTRRFHFDSYDLGNYTFSNTRRWESRSVYLSFTYGFGKMTNGKTKRQSRSNAINDENGVPELQ